MTTYNTGNPVGSTDARDLYDNAQNLDNMVNGSAASYTDRRGVSRRSLAGIDSAADNVLNSIGYAVPVAYASGISLTLTSQTVEYNGVVYAPKSSELPFTTSSWGADSGKFRAVQVTDAAYLSHTPAGTGAVSTTVQKTLRSMAVNLHGFLPDGYVLDGSVDYTAQVQSALNHLATSAASTLEFPQGFTLRLTGPVTMRAVGKTIDGTGVSVILASSTAGFQIAGNRNHTRGFRFSQSDQSFTPTAIYIFNDATTAASNYNRVVGVTGYDVYRGIHVYMGNTSGAAYRHVLYDCEFQNFYQQKTWSGSFGIAFDGPGSGNAGGNDSRCINCYCKGYEYNFIVNNSIATSFVNCSGDGAAYCFKYAGSSSGLRLIGGYYEYNDYLVNVVGGAKYDAYFLYPSIGNTVYSQVTGDGISFLSGGWGVGLGGSPISVSNGCFTSASGGIAEIFGVNGLRIYNDNTKVLRYSLNTADTHTFYGNILSTVGVGCDNYSNYTGGSTPLRIKTGGNQRIVFSPVQTDRVEVDTAGNLKPVVDGATSFVSLGAGDKRWNVVYAATGTINTSDERAKQDIAALDAAELRVAVALKGLVKKFRLKDAVSTKGDSARIHVGVIAQEVEATFQAEGLDANRYGILCYDEWAAELDEGGNELSPAGNRYGIRYEELLAFIIAAL